VYSYEDRIRAVGLYIMLGRVVKSRYGLPNSLRLVGYLAASGTEFFAPRWEAKSRLSNRLKSQEAWRDSSQCFPDFAMALSVVSSLRMAATKATFLGLPAAPVARKKL